MNRGLDNLIRLHRWRLAEKRQTVAELERLAARLRHELSEIDRRSVVVPAPAIDTPTGETIDDRHAAIAIARRAKLALSLSEVEDGMRGALSAVAHAVREIKKYDLVKARRERAAKEREGGRSQTAIEGSDSLHPRRRESV